MVLLVLRVDGGGEVEGVLVDDRPAEHVGPAVAVDDPVRARLRPAPQRLLHLGENAVDVLAVDEEGRGGITKLRPPLAELVGYVEEFARRVGPGGDVQHIPVGGERADGLFEAEVWGDKLEGDVVLQDQRDFQPQALDGLECAYVAHGAAAFRGRGLERAVQAVDLREVHPLLLLCVHGRDACVRRALEEHLHVGAAVGGTVEVDPEAVRHVEAHNCVLRDAVALGVCEARLI
mmetsp:Transcript_20566/g.60729  ORF Transcript_20566/g.60729 Transcript_20566/m.60729 type:complete len:233 (-) Transcript_20566:354-1052(-)